MTCVNCQNRIERALARTHGVALARVSYTDGRALVEYDPRETDVREITVAVEGLGYGVLPGGKKGKAGAGAADASGAGGDAAEAYADGSGRAHGLDVRRVVGILIIVVAAFFILRNLGFTTSFGDIPLAEDGMGYGLLFVIGLLTSVHCVAMCGGINISQCVPAGAGAPSASPAAPSHRGAKAGFPAATLAPSLKYNLARVCSYTAVGAIVGGIGSAISLSGDMKGLIQLIAGVFMVIMGLSMFGVLPGLGRLVPRMPRVFGDRIASAKSGGKGPVVVGLLNGLMPCGPLQAMQIFALSTGSPAQGALSMLCFSLGTVPLMFGLGALSSVLGGKFTSRAMTIGAALVIFLGLFMFTQGLTLSGVNVPGGAGGVYIAQGAEPDGSGGSNSSDGLDGGDRYSGDDGDLPAALTEGCCAPGAVSGGSPDVDPGNGGDSPGQEGLSDDASGVAGNSADADGDAEAAGSGAAADGSHTDAEGNSYATEDGVQIVHSVLSRQGYPHITVKAGAPVHWVIDASDDAINGCNGAIYIPEYEVEHAFAPGENVIDFTPEKPGEFMYSCWMGMITSFITVEA
ncbi:MAG: sulfite exporter TauE/SafE family protein [Clostridiales Family XIII bacterium]|jgi:sulfite exporter TauE/SafE/copper chaperone CopZ|nr:sulfite exporter TauE/SafE family protein [Clostridiales Family XIII bacterium]